MFRAIGPSHRGLVVVLTLAWALLGLVGTDEPAACLSVQVGVCGLLADG
jgi:hypothetical protein